MKLRQRASKPMEKHKQRQRRFARQLVCMCMRLIEHTNGRIRGDLGLQGFVRRIFGDKAGV